MKGKKTGGKVKGSVNKFTKSVKDVFKSTFEELQSDPKVKLSKWGKENPTEFYKLCSKMIPQEIEAKVEGELQIEQIFKIGNTEIKL